MCIYIYLHIYIYLYMNWIKKKCNSLYSLFINKSKKSKKFNYFGIAKRSSKSLVRLCCVIRKIFGKLIGKLQDNFSENQKKKNEEIFIFYMDFCVIPCTHTHTHSVKSRYIHNNKNCLKKVKFFPGFSIFKSLCDHITKKKNWKIAQFAFCPKPSFHFCLGKQQISQLFYPPQTKKIICTPEENVPFGFWVPRDRITVLILYNRVRV